MGRIIGGVDFKDRIHQNVSNILADTRMPFAWSRSESFDSDFFKLIRIFPPANASPCFSDDKDLFLLFDGEIIINDKQIDKDTPVNGNESLADKLKAIYLQKGPEYLCGLNGMYLIFVWDKNLKTLFIANDMVGLKPCYYWCHDNELYFGTQYEPFTRHPKFLKSINHEALIELMIMGCVLDDHTLFQHIKCLQPGCLLTCRDGSLNLKKQSLPDFSDSRWGRDTSLLVEEMTAYLEQSVAKRLKSGQKILIPLSGGLDSRAMAGFCNKYSPDITTLTFGLKKHIDVKIARRIAKKLNLPHIFFHQGDDFLVKYAEAHLDAIEGSAEPITTNIYPVIDYAQDNYQDIVSGYFGDCLHGENITNMLRYMKKFNSEPADSIFNYYSRRFTPLTLSKFLSNSLKQLVDAPGHRVKKFFNNLDGTIDYKCLLTDLYYRNRHYISCQLNILEDCARVHAPFTDIDYLKFIISLPPMAFEEKFLYQKMIAASFPEIAHLSNSNTMKPLIFSKDTIAHKLGLSLEVRKDFIFELPKHLLAGRWPKVKASMWDTFSCVAEPYRRNFGKILRELYDYLEPFFQIDTVDNLFFSEVEENPMDHGAKIRRITGFALWVKKYLT